MEKIERIVCGNGNSGDVMKKIISFIMILNILFFTMAVNVSAEENTDDINIAYEAIYGVISWKNSEIDSSVINETMIENAGTSAYDWFVFSLGRLGKDYDYSAYAEALLEYAVSDKSETVTDFQRIALTLTACGNTQKIGDILNKAVFSELNDENLNEKTANVLIYALLTLDSLHYKIPEDISLSRTSLISGILSSQLENGAFTLSGNSPDTDVTAMAIQSLAPYYNSEQIFTCTSNGKEKSITVREAVDSAIEYLSSIQLNDGDMPSWGKATCEGTAQTVIALCTMGINPDKDERFVKNGNSLIDGLMKYSVSDGGFAHTVENANAVSNSFASVQSLYSLCAYCRLCNGYRSLFDMREEQSEELYNKINNLIKSIDLLNTDNSDDLNKLLKEYSEIPLSERFYVYNFYKLSDILKEKGIENTADYTADDMYDTDCTTGVPVNVMSQRTDIAENKTIIGSPDSAVQPIPSQIQSSTAIKDHTQFNIIEVTVLIAIGIAAAAVLIINHRRQARNSNTTE